MALAYDMLYGIAAVLGSPLWGYRLLRTGKWRTDWPARFGRCALPPRDKPTILIHGVSVGEINAIRQLVKTLEDQAPDPMSLVISASTDTGIARARQLFEPRHPVVRFPFDFTFSMRRLLDVVRPDLVALVELEVWPNFIHECRRRHIPVGVINGRLSARSFRGYRKLAPLLRPTFAGLDFAAVQTSQYANRFTAMGVAPEAVTITDTMKWDTAQIADEVPGAEELAAAMGIDPGKPLIVAGSTAPDEEKLLMMTCPPGAQLLVAPRKPERFEEVAALETDLGRVIRRTQCPDGSRRVPDDARWFLLDTMGELRKAYALADVALIGRSFLGLYGSDPLEPIALGKPTGIGPHYGDFTDVVEALAAADGIEVTSAPGEFAAELLENRRKAQTLAERGRQVIRQRQGATQRTADLLLARLSRHEFNRHDAKAAR